MSAPPLCHQCRTGATEGYPCGVCGFNPYTPGDPDAPAEAVTPCFDCGGRGYTDWNARVDGGSCPRCGGAGVEGGYAALRGGQP